MTEATAKMMLDARSAAGQEILTHVLKDMQQALLSTVAFTEDLEPEMMRGTESGSGAVFLAVSALLLANLPTLENFSEFYYANEVDYAKDLDYASILLEMEDGALDDFGLEDARRWHMIQLGFAIGVGASQMVGEAIEMCDRAIHEKESGESAPKPYTND